MDLIVGNTYYIIDTKYNIPKNTEWVYSGFERVGNSYVFVFTHIYNKTCTQEIHFPVSMGTEIEKHVQPVYQAPPLGVMPRWLWLEKRADDLLAAINRYIDAGKVVNKEWQEEYFMIAKELGEIHAR